MRISHDLSFKAIANQLQIGVGTTHKIFSRFEDTGNVNPKVPSSRPESRKLDDLHELYILCLVVENPGLYLREMCQLVYDSTGVSTSESSICRLLRRNGFTRKKITQVAKQKTISFRGKYMADVLNYPRDYFVWADESGSDCRNQIRRCGYALKGEPPVYHRFLSRGTRYSAIAAISSLGLVDYEITTKTVNADKFADFVRGNLIPNMQPFPNTSSILIIDNCAVHHVDYIKDLVASAGILTIYLPPYSPDYNPIEKVFSYIKYYLKNHDEIIQSTNNFKHVLSSAFDSIDSEQCNAYISNCGYD